MVVLICVLYYAFEKGTVFGMLVGLWAGFLTDLFLIPRPGFYMAFYAAVGAFSGTLASKVFQDSFFAEIVFPLFLSYALLFFEALLVNAGTSSGYTPGQLFLCSFLPWRIAATAAVSPWLFSRLRDVSVGKVRRMRTRY
jgi:rod shape-determining protein MreD